MLKDANPMKEAEARADAALRQRLENFLILQVEGIVLAVATPALWDAW